MRRVTNIILAAAGVVIGLPILGIASLTIAEHTEPGRHAIEQLVFMASDGRVKIEGLSGRFPDALRARQVAISDQAGPWLTIDRVRLDWSPLRLIFGELRVATLSAAHASLARLPESSTAKRSHTTLLVRVTVDDLQLGRLDIAAPVAGAAVSVAVKGGLHWTSLEQESFALDIERLDGAGRYTASGTLSPDGVSGRLNVSELAHGLLSSIVGLPDLGPLSISAAVAGPRSAERARLVASAGPLKVGAHGTIDLVRKVVDIVAVATAPKMMPRPDLGWQSAGINVRLDGPFARPNASGHIDIEMLKAAGIAFDQFKADGNGSNGTLNLTGTLAGLRLPGPRPDLFAAAPFLLHATARLDASRRTVTFTLSHPLIAASGQVSTAGALAGSVAVTLPSLEPYAAIADIALQGHAALTAKFLRQGETTNVSANGTIGITGGLAGAAALFGDRATLRLAGTLHGKDVTLKTFEISGKSLHAAAKGERKNGVVDFAWNTSLSNLSNLAPAIAGTLAAQGHVQGSLQDLALTARATAQVATAGLPREPLAGSLQVQGLPDAPSGQLDVQGRLAGAPLALTAAVKPQGDGTLKFSLSRLGWKSAHGRGELTLAHGTSVPTGYVAFDMARLDEITPLIGVKTGGSIRATFDAVQTQGKPQVQCQLNVRHLVFGGGSVDRLTADARVADPMTHPVLTAEARISGIERGALTGDAQLTANGPLESVALRVSSNLRTAQGPAKLSAGAIAALSKRNLRLTSLDASYGGETAHLAAPAVVSFASGISIKDFRLTARRAVVTLTGRFTPTLALTLSARNLTPALVHPFIPGFSGSGAVALSGQLHGKLAAPEGTLHLTGRKLAIIKGSIGGLPPADVDATARLERSTALLDVHLKAGGLRLRLAGSAPLRSTAAVDLRATGTIDLTAFNALLTPNGRAAHGQATLNLGITGTIAQPRLAGTIRLARGSFEDFVRGVHITDLHGLIRADGQILRIAQLSGNAGGGTVSVDGTVGVLQAGLPMAITIDANNAVLPASDLLAATMSANLSVQRKPQGTLSVGGTIHVSKANINIPERFPKSVAVLNVRRPGKNPAPPPAPSQPVALALTIVAPQQLFVRGHGIDAEMGGTVRTDGTTAAPIVSGGFDLRHGTFNLAGQTLTFTKGKIAFGGADLTHKVDPTIDFVAENTANGVTATLTISGYADTPKIALSSSPDLPQDEILAHLLFGKSVKQLSPFQVAEIAQAIASISGVGGTNPLATVRKGLGLDRLTVSSASSGGTTAEAGKYIANGVYVGTKQGVSGGTQAQVQIDLTKRLKLESALGTGSAPATGATPDNDPGSSIGLSYQLEY